jgi:type I restriction enzyme, S subunit
MRSDLPDGWKYQPLAELGKLLKGKGGSKKDGREQGIPVVRYGEIYTRHHDLIRCFHSFVDPKLAKNYSKLQVGDVLFAGSGETLDEIGKSVVFLGPEPALGGGDTIIFRPKKEIDPLFLGYASNSQEAVMQKRHMGQGSSVIHIYTQNIEKLELPVPTLPEQRKIAAILSSVDQAIQATQAVIDQTRRVKEGLLQELLTKGIGHTRFKKTELGEIPESWEIRKLSEIAEVRSGIAKNSHRKLVDPINVAYLRVANVQDGYLDLNEIKKITIERKDVERYSLQVGDVLMNEGGDIDKLGRGDIWAGQVYPCVHQNHVFSVRCGPRIRSRFLSYLAESKIGKNYFLAKGKQTTNLASINKTQLNAFPVSLPSIEEQDGVILYLNVVSGSMSNSIKNLRELQQIKKGLLQDLLTGKVRVAV